MTTDRLRAAPLDTEHLVFIDDGHPIRREVPAPVADLYYDGYPVDEVNRYMAVNDKVDADSSAYLVVEVETTAVPLEDADYEQDKMRLFVCGCSDYVYRRGPFANHHEGPEDVGYCKHAMKIAQREKRKRADGQAALSEMGQ